MTDIALHAEENWVIDFTAHNRDGSVMTLLSGADIEFRVANLAGEIIMEKSVADGVEIINPSAGTAKISISVDDQIHAGLTAGSVSVYEIRVTNGSDISIQAEGRLKISQSLFAETIEPLILEFEMRFPEFAATIDDQLASLYIQDAIRIVDGDGTFTTDDRPSAIVYLAAHLLMMRKIAGSQFQTGGAQTGAVRAIRVEDRSVVFDTGSQAQQAALRTGLNQTAYGQRYLSMLRRNPRFILRA